MLRTSVPKICIICDVMTMSNCNLQISSKIKQDIQNSEALKDKIEALNTKIREEVKQNLQ